MPSALIRESLVCHFPGLPLTLPTTTSTRIWWGMRWSGTLSWSVFPRCRPAWPANERSWSRLKATLERSCTAWSRRWRLRERICRRWSLTRQLCRLSSSVLLLSKLLQQELAIRKILEWLLGTFQVWVILPLNKVLLTLSLQDSFNFEFLFFLWLVMKCFLQGCLWVCWFNH